MRAYLDIYGAGIVGGIVIPILGALPDGFIVLFSGLSSGTHEEIRDRITVGIGTLLHQPSHTCHAELHISNSSHSFFTSHKTRTTTFFLFSMPLAFCFSVFALFCCLQALWPARA